MFVLQEVAVRFCSSSHVLGFVWAELAAQPGAILCSCPCFHPTAPSSSAFVAGGRLVRDSSSLRALLSSSVAQIPRGPAHIGAAAGEAEEPSAGHVYEGVELSHLASQACRVVQRDALISMMRLLDDGVPSDDHIEIISSEAIQSNVAAATQVGAYPEVAGKKAFILTRLRDFFGGLVQSNGRRRKPRRCDIDHISFHDTAAILGEVTAHSTQQSLCNSIKQFLSRKTSGAQSTKDSMHLTLLPVVVSEFCEVLITDVEIAHVNQCAPPVDPVVEAQPCLTLRWGKAGLDDGGNAERGATSSNVAASSSDAVVVMEESTSNVLYDQVSAQVAERYHGKDAGEVLDGLVLSEVERQKQATKLRRSRRACSALRKRCEGAVAEIENLRAGVKDIADATQFRGIGRRNISTIGKYHLGLVRSHGNVSARTALAILASSQWCGELKHFRVITRLSSTHIT